MSVITFTWEPDPAVLGQSMLAVAGSLADRKAPLLAASEAVREDIRERFETETDPSGDPWEQWAESYKEHAESYPNKGILQQSMALVEAASSTEATVVTGDTVFYRTNVLPHYGLAHESGLPDRKHPLPQRSFLGLSAQAASVIFGFFSEWFDGAIALYPTARGKIGRRHSFRAIPGGFFIPR